MSISFLFSSIRIHSTFKSTILSSPIKKFIPVLFRIPEFESYITFLDSSMKLGVCYISKFIDEIVYFKM